MIKKLPFMFTALSLSLASFAQQNLSEMAPTYLGETPTTNQQIVNSSSDRAFWDVQLDVNPTTIVGGLAGVCWIGNEFWVSRWGNDTLYVLDASGAQVGLPFVIAGVTGTRCITWDGTSVYLGTNGTSIYKVNPTTKTLTSTISTSVPNIRYCTYDPTLNSSAGGFWCGTWTTDITAVSMTGATLTTIPAASHGLSGIYGMAYDGYSLTGPFLWAFDQTAGSTDALLVQLDMSGNPTGVVHDTHSDLTGTPPNTGISGGLFITNSFVTGEFTIGGLSQNVSLFAYELASGAGVEENNAVTLSIYPNPANNNLTISTNSNSVENVNVYAMNGQLVLSNSLNSKTIDVSSLEAGVYLIQVQTENGIASQRFIKE